MNEMTPQQFTEEIIKSDSIVTLRDYSNKNIQFVQDADDEKLILEQYKVVVESLKSIADIREKANSFWVTVNSLGITAIAYIRQAEGISQNNKPILLWTLLILGIVLCSSWIMSLFNVKKIVDINNFLLVELEKYLPAKVFTTSFKLSQGEQGKTSLTLKEMIVPCLFLLGYGLFAVMLYFFQEEVAIVK